MRSVAHSPLHIRFFTHRLLRLPTEVGCVRARAVVFGGCGRMRPRLVVTLTGLTSLPAQLGNDDDDDDGDPTAAAYPAFAKSYYAFVLPFIASALGGATGCARGDTRSPRRG